MKIELLETTKQVIAQGHTRTGNIEIDVEVNIFNKLMKESPTYVFNNKEYFISKTTHFDIVKSFFYSHSSSRWRTKQTIKVLKINNVILGEFVVFLEETLGNHHRYNKRGKKTNYTFLNDLKKRAGKPITHKTQKENNLMSSLEVLRNWKNEYLDISDETLLDFIHKNIDFPYTRDTLRFKYYDIKKIEKK